MINRNKVKTKLIITYLLILIICLIIFNIISSPSDQDKNNVIVGLLGWSATIYAPIAAYLLLDNWKVQKKYEIQKEIIIKAIEKLALLDRDIKKYCSYHFALKNISEEVILLHNYKEFNVEKRQDQLLEIFSELNLIVLLTKDEEISTLFYEYEGAVLHLDKLNKKFYLSLYPLYYKKINRPIREQTTIEVGPYKSNLERDTVSSEISEFDLFYNINTAYSYFLEMENKIYNSNKLDYLSHFKEYKYFYSKLINALLIKIDP
ncbi:hypothetical protein ABLT91_10645 [Acinetobacter pittii]|uniref:hypothetical protein n=1 Tax=Acinetobacter pittii TaxID=48296 RepID=UPI0024DE7C86|nr:hypothetical protein [Acinetobacter pittii]